jgi:hypothetical protein
MTPVYPKENLEYRERVLERFRKLVKDTRWDTCEDRIQSSRGRKPKQSVRIETKPRSSEKYNWL